MKSKILILALLLISLMLAACKEEDDLKSEGRVEQEAKPSESVETISNLPEEVEEIDNSVKISNVQTDLVVENGWSIVPSGVSEMTITVEADNVDLVLFWIAPTGTGTGLERALIGYDLDGSDGWSINWKFGDRTFHDHLTVQALGLDGATQASETFNVHSMDEDGE